MSADETTFTPTQRRFLAVLADGQPHRRRELRACLADDLGAERNIRAHIWAIRKKLLARGEHVVCELYCGVICYRHIRLIRTPNPSV